MGKDEGKGKENMDVSMSDSDSDEFAMNAMKELEKHIMEHEF